MIKVDYSCVSTRYMIEKVLKKVEAFPIISFDTETRGLYNKELRKEAKEYLKLEDADPDFKKSALQVIGNSGLSFPTLTRTTHFVFGLSSNFSVIIICRDSQTELRIWNWLAEFKGKVIVHNALYDLKIMYNRIGKFPQDYIDTQILSKCFINNVKTWKAKVSLKVLMGDNYDPSWGLMDDYEPEDLKDPKFIKYASIDGAATFKLWIDINYHIHGDDWEEPVNPEFLL